MANLLTDMRYEHKFVIDDNKRIELQNKLEQIMQRDVHTHKGTYIIKSLYFDDYTHSCFFENEYGYDNREKFRIRYYNDDKDFIRLELKSKTRGMTEKKQCAVSLSQAVDMQNNNFCEINEQFSLLRKFFIETKTNLLHPDVIVEYERIPYIYEEGNVRITFDTNICGSNETEKFLSGDYHKIPILPGGLLVMEIKYDDILPGFIEDIVQVKNLGKETFSKFYLCKKAFEV